MTLSFDWLDPGDPRPEVRAALRAWLAFQIAFRLDPVKAAEALARDPDPRVALGARGASAARLDAAVSALRRVRAVALPLRSSAYPPRLAALPDPAPVLLVRGDPGLLARPGVAVVGSRAATKYGLRIARALGRDLAAAGLVVISGLARGIDAAAHEGALEAGGPTLAFQACGPDRIYPPEHAELAERIAACGAVATEHPPGAPPRPAHFPLRNRLLAGAALALVVVEARPRSGSLTTASHAARQDLDVFAVPGPVDAPTSAGANGLLADGAFVARSADDVLSLLAFRGHWRPARRSRRRPLRAPAEGESEIVRALRDAPATPDELARRLGKPPERLALELLELELAGTVVAERDGRLRVSAR